LLKEGAVRQRSTPTRTQRSALQQSQSADQSFQDVVKRTSPRASSRSLTPGTQRLHDEASWQGRRRLVAEISPRHGDTDCGNAGDQQSMSSWPYAPYGNSTAERSEATNGGGLGYLPRPGAPDHASLLIASALDNAAASLSELILAASRPGAKRQLQQEIDKLARPQEVQNTRIPARPRPGSKYTEVPRRLLSQEDIV
jgi:hypothetical protein